VRARFCIEPGLSLRCWFRLAPRLQWSVARAGSEGSSRREVLEEVRRLGRNGDWLVIRGYHPSDHHRVRGYEYAMESCRGARQGRRSGDRGGGRGVHTTPLRRVRLEVPPAAAGEVELGDREVFLSTPSSMHAVGRQAIQLPGLAGLDIPDRYYCSELAVAVYRAYIPGTHVPRPDTPAQLHYWGRILYDSGEPLADSEIFAPRARREIPPALLPYACRARRPASGGPCITTRPPAFPLPARDR
jgi:hypothetical protein